MGPLQLAQEAPSLLSCTLRTASLSSLLQGCEPWGVGGGGGAQGFGQEFAAAATELSEPSQCIC